ncbi:GNAT superfamily N-acetyltransferase [Sedimentibacter acidaminivorans]|uniref:GNAT superfamily N-acetyltransferase n=1 Tax=Sedimentibacter acidaminivorans TaxID=913099 RepID=A0ABS4GAF0_9FIRM|nr:GNAT family N-acetyltransferase [Sedimentibacter acidaminivorans]MBP1924670.1 GNAT superfamily N-acetyltransferase [Sedimentibacter acidaminivorans]
MENIEVITQAEINIPKSYLNCQITSCGRMFCDIDNKDSYASNYAVIDNNKNLENAIEEIDKFYNHRGIKPKIFNRIDSLELDVLRNYFKDNDYKLREFELESMVLNMKGKIYCAEISNVKSCDIKKENKNLKGKEYDLAVEQDDGDTYGVNQLNKQIASGGIIFFAYDEFNNPASMVLGEKYNDVVYISNVYTTPSKRRMGYGLSVMNSLLLHYTDSIFYLYSSNPKAISIYNKLGFKGQNLKSWWAIKGELPEWCK